MSTEPIHQLTGSMKSEAKHPGDRLGYRTIHALDPRDGKMWDVYISEAKIEKVRKDGVGHLMEMAHTLPFGLTQPTHVFQGVRRQIGDGTGEAEDLDLEVNDWLCYISRPSERYDLRTGNVRSATLDRSRPRVFAVYVTARRVVYWWNWVESDAHMELPLDYDERYEKLVYRAE